MDQDDRKLLNQFKSVASDILGDQLRKPITAKLGYMDAQGNQFVKVPSARTDQPQKYYFHEAGGTPFQGEAFLRSGSMQDWQLRYNTPIRLQRDILSSEYYIVGLDERFAAQFFSGIAEDDGKVYGYDKLAPGLLSPTSPVSMSARVLAASYRIGDEYKYIPTLATINWGVSPHSSNVPTVIGDCRYVLVEVDYDNEILMYTYGDILPLSYSRLDAYSLTQQGVGNYLPPLSGMRFFKAGYVRLHAQMTYIVNDNIWHMQDYISSATTDITILDRIVTDDDGNVVVDSETGNVVYA